MIKWTKEPPLRSVRDLGEVLSDIDSHMPAGHIYRDSDKITWGHETTHGINARLRMKYRERGKINCFYVLKNRSVIISEPNTTLKEVAANVPKPLRGKVYNLYMVQQTRYWNDSPLYVFDEWTAYANGSAVRLDLGITKRGETVAQMLEFSVYAMTLAMVVNSSDMQLKEFLRWHLDRARWLYYQNESLGVNPVADEYLRTFRTSPDAQELRTFMQSYLGANWCKVVLELET